MGQDLEANKRVVRRYVDEIQNEHRLERMGEIFAADVVDHMDLWGGAWQGLAAYEISYPRLLAGLPDLSSVVHFQIAEDDRVVTFKTARGTHLGRFLGQEPTGRALTFTIIDIFRIRDGRISDFWGLIDEAACLRQMGLLGGADLGPAETAAPLYEAEILAAVPGAAGPAIVEADAAPL